MYFQVYTDKRGEHRWRLKAGNHQIVAVSSESYVDKSSCLHSIDLVKGASEAPVREV